LKNNKTLLKYEQTRSPTHHQLGEVFKTIYRKELDRLHGQKDDSDGDDYDDYDNYDFSGDVIVDDEIEDVSMEQ